MKGLFLAQFGKLQSTGCLTLLLLDLWWHIMEDQSCLCPGWDLKKEEDQAPNAEDPYHNLLKVPPPPHNARLVTKDLKHGRLGDIADPNYSKGLIISPTQLFLYLTAKVVLQEVLFYE